MAVFEGGRHQRWLGEIECTRSEWVFHYYYVDYVVGFFSQIRREDQQVFDEAVGDIRWVLGQLLRLHSPPGPPNPPPPPLANAPKPVTTVSWMVRPVGKRQPKPTYKLRG